MFSFKRLSRFFLVAVTSLTCSLLPGCFDPQFVNTCFLPGTLISSPNGPVPIESLQFGQVVYSYDEETGAVVDGIIDMVLTRQVESYLELTLSNGVVLQVTPDHPLAVRGKDNTLTWIEAGKVGSGQTLVTMADELSISSESVQSIQSTVKDVTVYNLKVRHYRNSFAEGVLTHFYFQNGQQLAEQ